VPRSLSTTILAALAFVLAACGGGEPDLDIGDAQAAEPVSGSSQIVLEISNDGDGDDRLDEVTSPAAIGVEIHRTEIEDGRATMAELDGIDVPAGETVRFRPGDLHLMLVVPDETVRVGGTFDLTLSFDRSGEVTVPVEVVDLLDLAESEEDLELLDPDAVDPDGEGADDGVDGEVEDDDA
jgi:periplasmic copper chaperone A